MVELYEPVAEDAGLALRLVESGPLPVKGNRELLSQALANLIDNGIKYAAPQPEAGTAMSETARETASEIVVEARAEGHSALIAVADRGPGIPAEERARAVERFVRLESSRSRPGSGLGLSLASAVASLHGGELRLEDNAPGLRVVLILPRAEAAS